VEQLGTGEHGGGAQGASIDGSIYLLLYPVVPKKVCWLKYLVLSSFVCKMLPLLLFLYYCQNLTLSKLFKGGMSSPPPNQKSTHQPSKHKFYDGPLHGDTLEG
jgi:hypothetical protein